MSIPRLQSQHESLNQPNHCHHGRVIQETHSSLKAKVFIATLNGKCVVVKDYSASHPIIRATLCQWLIKREIAAIKRLQEHPGVPKMVGKFGQFGFAIELIEGTTIDNSMLKNKPSLMTQIDQTINTMHRFGVTHNDIRNKNFILDRNEKLYIVDFASAVIRPNQPWPVLEWLYILSRFSDRVKIVRLKQQFNIHTLNSRDKRLLKFVMTLKLLSRFWKNYVYRLMKRVSLRA